MREPLCKKTYSGIRYRLLVDGGLESVAAFDSYAAAFFSRYIRLQIRAQSSRKFRVRVDRSFVQIGTDFKGLLMQHFILNEFNITKVTSRIDALAIRNK